MHFKLEKHSESADLHRAFMPHLKQC